MPVWNGMEKVPTPTVLGTDTEPLIIVAMADVLEKIALQAFHLEKPPVWPQGVTHAVMFLPLADDDSTTFLVQQKRADAEKQTGFLIYAHNCFLTDEEGALGFINCKHGARIRVIPVVKGAKVFQEIPR